MKIKLLLAITLLLATIATGETQEQEHVLTKGMQTIGIRYGVGTKNRYDIGLTYSYSLGNKYTLICELDHEEATFGNSDFTNVFLLSPSIDIKLWEPQKWLTYYVGGGPAIGYDKWESDIVNDKESGIAIGAQAGMNFEIHPWKKISLVAKAQQYIIYSNSDCYLKPNFSLGIKYKIQKGK
jgi:hypothetical protein